MGKFGNLLNLSSCNRKSSENSTDISTLLHGDDSQLIFLINPNKEGLLGVVEDSTSFWPVAVEVTGLKESISLLEKEVIFNQLSSLSISQRAKRVESASKFSIKFAAGFHNLCLNFIPLLFCDGRAQRIVFKVTTNSNTSRHDHSSIFCREWWALELSVVHITRVNGTLSMTMVLFDDLVHQWCKGCV